MKSYKLDDKKKVITIYTNATEEEKAKEKELREFYLLNGYKPVLTEKKTLTVAKMKKDLSGDKEALAKFEKLYAEKTTEKNPKFGETGMGKATKFYNDWKKKNKAE